MLFFIPGSEPHSMENYFQCAAERANQPERRSNGDVMYEYKCSTTTVSNWL